MNYLNLLTAQARSPLARVGQKIFNMEIKVIKTEQDYNQTLKRLEIIFHAEIDSPERDEAEVLSILIE